MNQSQIKQIAKRLALGGGIGFVVIQAFIFIILLNVYGCAGKSFSGPDTSGCVGTLHVYEIIIRVCIGLAVLCFAALIAGIVVLIARRKD